MTMTVSRALVPAALLFVTLAGPVAFADGPAPDLVWADRWNSAYHNFTDLDGDGRYQSDGEVSFILDPLSWTSFPAQAMRTTIENRQRVWYWIAEFDDTILRGVDVDSDGTMSGSEIRVFRDSGALDGQSWAQGLDVADDGGVWWIAGLSIANPQNGLSRLEDLNGDGDAADPGEQIVMVDGAEINIVEHDAGTSAIADPWSMRRVAAVGDGVMTYITGDDQCVYRFEDTNGDGDVTDPGESKLLLNATGEHPDLPMNPDFADGTFRPMLSEAGWPAQLVNLVSVVEDGERVFYFGTGSSPFTDSGTSVSGLGLNFLIYRGVDGNDDGDVNDAGEVTLFFDGSSTGPFDRLILRSFDAADGGVVYVTEVLPYPVLFPGPEGNTWIHRLEDLNGDGDAMDPGEFEPDLFDLQEHGYTEYFPLQPDFGTVMSDPWDLMVVQEPSISADLDGDGVVGFTDLLTLLAAWGTDGADLDGDGTTAFTDLLALLAAWGRV